MSKKIKYLLFIFIIFIFTSCSVNKDTQNNSIDNNKKTSIINQEDKKNSFVKKKEISVGGKIKENGNSYKQILYVDNTLGANIELAPSGENKSIGSLEKVKF